MCETWRGRPLFRGQKVTPANHIFWSSPTPGAPPRTCVKMSLLALLHGALYVDRSTEPELFDGFADERQGLCL